MTATSTLRIRNLGKRYSATDTWALRHLTLDLPFGSLIALLGANGAGKSTFIHLLSGTITPSEGGVEPLPPDITIGWCSQKTSIDWFLDVYENVLMGARLAGFSRRESHALTERAIEIVRLSDKARQQTDTISGGQLQRVQIARALVTNPDVLLLDEPTVGLDVESSEAVLADLRRRADDGALVLVSSHDLGLLETWCDRVLLIADGELVAFESRDAFMARFAAEEILDITTTTPEQELPDSVRARLDRAGIRIIAPDDPQHTPALCLAIPRGTPLGRILPLLEPELDVLDLRRTTPGLREAYLAFSQHAATR